MEGLADFVKIIVKPKYSFVICIAAFAILYVELPEKLRLARIQEDFGPYIGVVALLSFVLWVVEITLLYLAKLREFCTDLWVARRHRKQFLKTLDDLSADEQYILARHLVKDKMALGWPKGRVALLLHKGLMEEQPVSTIAGPLCKVEATVWQHLLRKKEEFISKAKQANPDCTDL